MEGAQEGDDCRPHLEKALLLFGRITALRSLNRPSLREMVT